MNNFWVLATEHWFLGFLVIIFSLQISFLLVNRTYRLILILFRGWPTTPYMDADGDICFPDEKKG